MPDLKKSDKKQSNTLEEADKVLKELMEIREKKQKEYNKRLLELHRLFKKEPAPDFQKLDNILKSLDNALKMTSPEPDVKIAGWRVLKRFRRFIRRQNFEVQKQQIVNQLLQEYLGEILRFQSESYQWQNLFLTGLLQFTQVILPLVHDLSSEVTRRNTVFPVERMDIIYGELTRQIEQMRSDLQRLKAKQSGSE